VVVVVAAAPLDSCCDLLLLLVAGVAVSSSWWWCLAILATCSWSLARSGEAFRLLGLVFGAGFASAVPGEVVGFGVDRRRLPLTAQYAPSRSDDKAL
jgi:hypothetical protein